MKQVSIYPSQEVKKGSVYILQHSMFKDMVQFGCCSQDPQARAKELSAKTRLPGEFNVVSEVCCYEPCKVKKRLQGSLQSVHYVEEYYQLSPEDAEKALQREVLRIPVIGQ